MLRTYEFLNEEIIIYNGGVGLFVSPDAHNEHFDLP